MHQAEWWALKSPSTKAYLKDTASEKRSLKKRNRIWVMGWR